MPIECRSNQNISEKRSNMICGQRKSKKYKKKSNKSHSPTKVKFWSK